MNSTASSYADLTVHYSLEAENSVLGALILDNASWLKIGHLLQCSDFYSSLNRRVFSALRSLLDIGKPADVILVAQSIAVEGDVQGIFVYLTDLLQNTPSSANIVHYANIVRDYRIRRDVMTMAQELYWAAAKETNLSASDLVEQAISKVVGMADERKLGPAPQSLGRVLSTVIEAIEVRARTGMVGLSSGFSSLDRLINGFQVGDLVIIAGRPGMGKTTLAQNIAENVASEGGISLFVSLEMSAEQLGERFAARFGNIGTERLRAGNVSVTELEDIKKIRGHNRSECLVVADDPAMAYVSRIRASSLKLKLEKGRLDLVVIDYLQLLTAYNGSKVNRNEELSGITRSIKLLARELKVPVLLLSQLSRRVEDRPDRRPILSDLRDSGAIEQDADLVLMCYRDDYYDKNSRQSGKAEIIVRKNRMGPVGGVLMDFDGRFCRFADAGSNNMRAPEEKGGAQKKGLRALS